MKQSKRLSAIESLSNTIIGLLVSFTVQSTLFPYMGIQVSTQQNITITLVFFCTSFIRGFAIRRFFNRLRG